MNTEYKYILHPNKRYTALKSSTAARWAEARKLSDIMKHLGPTQAALDHDKRYLKRARGRAARAKRKAMETNIGWQIRANRPLVEE